jgi:hypothetical protein
MTTGMGPERGAGPESGQRQVCGHLGEVRDVSPESRDTCPECVAAGDTWVHLRECPVCGHVGCCDSSKNKHATAHHEVSGHPLIRSLEPGEAWWWCYDDGVLFEVEGVPPLRAA